MTATPDRADLSMTYLMHHALRRDLAAFARAVPRTPVAELDTWRALLRRWDVLTGVLRQTLRPMEAEHDEIDRLLSSCGAGLRKHVTGHAGADDRAALAVRLCAARESLGRHLAHEDLEPLQLPVPLPWALHQVPEDVRRDLLRAARPAQRTIWRMTHRRFERLDRRAFRHLA